MANHFSAYLKQGNNTFKPADNVSVVKILESGLYNVTQDSYGAYTALKKAINIKELLVLPEKNSEEVLTQIRNFYKQKELFKKWNFNHKRGILIHGVPGGGKTSLISCIINFACTEIEGVAFYVPSYEFFNIYKGFITSVFREIEPDRPIIVIIEDIDSYFTCGIPSIESNLLNTIDGVENKDNILYLATTNYPEKLPERVYNRPGRFDLKIEIKTPTAESRKFYFTNKILSKELATIDLDKWISDTEGFTIAQMSELVKSFFLMEIEYDAAIAALKNNTIPNSRNYNKELLGFKTK